MRDFQLSAGCPEFLNGRVNRRELLRVGGLSYFGLTLAGTLRGQASAAEQAGTRPAGARSRPAVRSIILLQHYGAPSHIDTWDPKPEAPAEIRGEFGTTATSLPGLRISDIMPRTAKICHLVSLVRSMTHRTANHNPATYLAITGRTSDQDQVQVGATPTDWPAYGSVVSKLRPTAGQVPPFVSLPHVAFDQVYKCPGQWGGMLGKKYDPLIVARDPSSSQFSVEELSLPADISDARLGDRRELLRIVDSQVRRAEASLPLRGLDDLYGRAFSILTSPAARKAFDLGREDRKLREAYGMNKVGQSYLLARRLVEAGVQFVTCFNGSNPGDGWDTHANNFPQLKDKLCPPDDQAYSALLLDLEARGLLDSTLVIWAGEFGRKPQIGKAGFTNLIAPGGRDHWPPCYTVAFAGGGVKRGFLYSASDSIAAYPADKPVTPADLAATIFWSLGINPETEMRDQLGRPFRLADGHPVTELFGSSG